MVRHEAAEALGAIAEPQCIQLLKEFQADQEPIVADSCVVRGPPRVAYLVVEQCRVWSVAWSRVQRLGPSRCAAHVSRRLLQWGCILGLPFHSLRITGIVFLLFSAVLVLGGAAMPRSVARSSAPHALLLGAVPLLTLCRRADNLMNLAMPSRARLCGGTVEALDCSGTSCGHAPV